MYPKSWQNSREVAHPSIHNLDVCHKIHNLVVCHSVRTNNGVIHNQGVCHKIHNLVVCHKIHNLVICHSVLQVDQMKKAKRSQKMPIQLNGIKCHFLKGCEIGSTCRSLLTSNPKAACPQHPSGFGHLHFMYTNKPEMPFKPKARKKNYFYTDKSFKYV